MYQKYIDEQYNLIINRFIILIIVHENEMLLHNKARQAIIVLVLVTEVRTIWI